MEQKLIQARTIAGVLGVLLIIALVVVWNDGQKIAQLNASGKQNISATADTIRQDCSSTDPVAHAKCGDDLQQLSDLLAQFSKGLPTTPTH